MPDQITQPPRRDIPADIKRKVRQRCHFGCVICGLPLYEYDHMDGWANLQRHVVEEITLLCDKHHKEKTNHLLPLEDVKRANAEPYNLGKGASTPYALHFSGRFPEIQIGSNSFTADLSQTSSYFVPILVDRTPLVGFFLIENHLFFELKFFDEFNQLCLSVAENELMYSVAPWDIELIGRKLTIREAPRNIFVEIEFHPPDKIVINRGRLLCNGVEILISPENIQIPYAGTFHGNGYQNKLIAISVGEEVFPGTAISVKQVSRYPPRTSSS